MAANKTISGKDKPQYALTTQDEYWTGVVQTGDLYLVPEGEKTAVKHIIIHTYSDTTIGDGSNRPRIIVLVKSLEDSDWTLAGQDTSGTAISMTDAALSGTYTAWSRKIADGDDATTIFYLPVGDSSATHYVDGRTANIYLETGGTYTLQTYGTHYTADSTTPYKITFTTAPTSSQDIYYSWNNKPEVVLAAGDFFNTTDGYHRVTAVSNMGSAELDHYAPSGSTYTDVDHYPSYQIPDGEGQVKLGINKLTEGMQVKIIVIPEYNTGAAPTIVKITGISIGHIPQGRKILEATGS